MKDNVFKRIQCKRCSEDIGKDPVFTEFHVQMMKKKKGNFNFIQDRHRCLNCLKYLAKDPSKVGVDEVAKLKNCSGCDIAKYCFVGDCQEKHNVIHKWFCKPKCDFSKEELAWRYNSLLMTWDKDDRVVPKHLSDQELDEMDLLQVIHHYVQGILSLNGALLEHFLQNSNENLIKNEFVDSRIKTFNYTLTNLVCAASMFREDWNSVWECVKSQFHNPCHNFTNVRMSQNLADCGMHENIITALKKDEMLLDTTNFIAAEEQEWIVYNYAFYLCMAAVVKINVIENMKSQLVQYNEHIRKTRPRKKFFHRPRILNCITLYILGKEVHAFEKDIVEQEKHLTDIFQVLDNIYIGNRAVGSLQIFELLNDSSKRLSLKDKVWWNDKKASKVTQYVVDTNFIWNYYFSINSAAKEYVIKYLGPVNKNELRIKLLPEWKERLGAGSLHNELSSE